MPKTHPEEKLLEKFGRGKLNRRENMKVSWHLFNCASCRQEVARVAPEGSQLLEGLFSGLNPQDVADTPSYDRAFSFGRSTLEVRGEARDRDRARAPKLYNELMRHPVSRQRALIERTWRFKNYIFAEYLLEQCQAQVTEDPTRAEDMGRLALVVAEQLVGSHYGSALINDLKARSWAHIANSLRVQTDLRAADEAFAKAEEHYEQGTDDILLGARLLTLKGALRREQRKFEEASELTEKAIEVYREAGENHWVGRTLLSRAHIELEADRPEAGLALLEEALPLIDTEREPRLLHVIKSSMMGGLYGLGRYKEAEKLLPEMRKLAAAHGSSVDSLRDDWAEARLAREQDRLDRAEELFLKVRDAFIERRIPYDVALAALELAMVYLKQGRTTETKALAEEMLPIFRSHGVHKEATAALLIFHKAAQTEEATLKMVQDIATFLQRARRNPDLVYTAS